MLPLLRKLMPPKVPRTIPPGTVPGERRTTWASLLDKPGSLSAAGLSLDIAGPVRIYQSGQAPLVTERTDAAAGVRPVIALKRNGTLYGHIGLDASDRLAIIAADGTTVLAYFATGGIFSTAKVEVTTHVKTPKVLDGSGTQVLAARQTGWSAWTSTADRSSHATYNGDTAGAAYDQTKLQAVMDGLQQVSQAMKALLDDAITHGWIGA